MCVCELTYACACACTCVRIASLLVCACMCVRPFMFALVLIEFLSILNISSNFVGFANLTSSEITTLEEEAQKMGAKFLLFHRGTDLGDDIKSKSSFRKIRPDSLKRLLDAAKVTRDDLFLVCGSQRESAANWAMGKVRVLLAGKLKLVC